MYTNIVPIDKYLELIGKGDNNLVAIWEQGSYLENINDEFSDRDFAIIWKNSFPLSKKRLESASKLGFDIHEIKDIDSIGQGFDMFSDGTSLFNIGHGTNEKELKWYDALNNNKLPSDLEEILMSISALDTAKVYYQKDKWVDKLKAHIKITPEIRKNIINHYSNKASVDLKLLQKSSVRGDLLQFLKYLEKVIRYLQLIYLIKQEKPIVSPKHFEKRFARVENGEITKLVKKVSSRLNMQEIFKDATGVASLFDIKPSMKYKA